MMFRHRTDDQNNNSANQIEIIGLDSVVNSRNYGLDPNNDSE